MSNKTKVVVDTGKGCRILINPTENQYKNTLHLMNPDLLAVQGVPPEYWCIRDGQVFPVGFHVRKTEKNPYPYSVEVRIKHLEIGLKKAERGIFIIDVLAAVCFVSCLIFIYCK